MMAAKRLPTPRRLVASLALACVAVAWPSINAQSIYTCVDARGRRITADRPIPECSDREQRELSTTGATRRTVKPVPTADEAALLEVIDKGAAEERVRVAEEKRRDRATLSRYPNKNVHDKERGEALGTVEDAIKGAHSHLTALAKQRKGLEVEMEFYRKDPGKAPPTLKRQLAENDASVEVQKRFIANQEEEKNRVNKRFDDELARLRTLWARQAAAPAASGAVKP